MMSLARVNLAAPAALAGTADTAIFLAQRPELFAQAPGRAAGSVAFAALWTALTVSAATDGMRSSTRTTVLAAVVMAGNAAMLAVHLRANIATPRVFAGAALSAIALADVLRRR